MAANELKRLMKYRNLLKIAIAILRGMLLLSQYVPAAREGRGVWGCDRSAPRVAGIGRGFVVQL